jgi:hypothetical protein
LLERSYLFRQYKAREKFRLIPLYIGSGIVATLLARMYTEEVPLVVARAKKIIHDSLKYAIKPEMFSIHI